MLATYTLDEAADWLLAIALALLVFDRTGSALAVAALLLATRFGPSLLITPVAGRLGTIRLGRVLGGLYLGAAVAAVLVAAATSAPLAILYGLTFVASSCAAIGRVLTRTAGCNALDPHGLLREGAAALNMSSGAVNVLGPAAAGTVATLVGTQAAVIAAAVVFAGLAAGTRSLQVSPAGAVQDEPPVPFREALSVLTAGPGVAAMLLGATMLLVLFAMDEPILLPYLEQSLDGGASEFATFWTFWGVGLLLGGVAFTLLRRWSMLGTFVLSGSLFAGAYLTLGGVHTLGVAYAAAIVGGMGNGMFWATITVVTLEAVPPTMRARTSGLTESLALATPGVGYVLGGALSELLSPADVYVLAGGLGGCVVIALGIALWRPSLTPPPFRRTAIVPSPTQGG